MDQAAVFRLVQRVAHRAGIAHADRLSPHSLRHSLITALLRQGAPLHWVQHLLGHVSSQAFGQLRYPTSPEHDGADLDGLPAYTIAQLFTHND